MRGASWRRTFGPGKNDANIRADLSTRHFRVYRRARRLPSARPRLSHYVRSLCGGTERLRRSPPGGRAAVGATSDGPRRRGLWHCWGDAVRVQSQRSAEGFLQGSGCGDRNARRRAGRHVGRLEHVGAGPQPQHVGTRPADGQSASALGSRVDLLRSPHDRAGETQFLWLDVSSAVRS